MDSLTAARAQMEVSLGFHIVFSALGIAMPLLMVIAEGIALRTGDARLRALAKTWGEATALLFVIGAVSGTALSFELGLLWPRMMAFAGPVIGPAFALEGYAFFLEAIFVGLYLYGWDRLSPRMHWLCGVPVAVSGMLSGVLVIAANAWMQHPRGWAHVVDGVPTETDPMAVFSVDPWLTMAAHATLASYAAVGFAVAGIYALAMARDASKRDDGYHRNALAIALSMAIFASLLQPLSGHLSAQATARNQPVKLAAIEGLFESRTEAPAAFGGVPDLEHNRLVGAIEVPYALSILAFGSPHARVQGLLDFPVDERPNVLICHFAFDLMVACGGAMALVAALSVGWSVRARRRGEAWLPPRWLLRSIVLASPLGFVALEAGWLVTEAGRQPWAVFGVMRTRDAVTLAHDATASLWTFSCLYLALGVILVAMLRKLGRDAHSRATS